MNNAQKPFVQTPVSSRQVDPRAIPPGTQNWSAEEVLRWAGSEFGSEIAIASAFGAEGIVLLEIASRVLGDLRVFILDTGFLFPETLDLIAKVERRYAIRVERVVPQISVEQQAEFHGPALWDRDPDLCCHLRKVEPLRQKLAHLKAWATAIRRDQTPERRHIGKVEWDSNFHLLKINPLADWTHEMVWAYIRKHNLDYNPLHDRNYPSIGCTHCTKPVREGESPRSGRWPGLAKQECGMHLRARAASASSSTPPECNPGGGASKG